MSHRLYIYGGGSVRAERAENTDNIETCVLAMAGTAGPGHSAMSRTNGHWPTEKKRRHDKE